MKYHAKKQCFGLGFMQTALNANTQPKSPYQWEIFDFLLRLCWWKTPTKAKQLYILIIILSLNNIAYSQKEDATWLMGYNAWDGGYYGISHLSFDTLASSNPIIDTTYSTVSLNMTNANISDKNGNLLFYTNGIVVMNQLNDTMLNATGLSPCVHTDQNTDYGLMVMQGALILPKPQTPNLYYLFHETINLNGGDLYVDKLLYSVIDMTQDNGKGAVIQKNTLLSGNSTWSLGRFSATKHANGRDWWLIKPYLYSGRYYSYLIQPDTILGPFIQDFNDTSTFKCNDGVDQSCFSPNGNKYVHSEGYRNERFFLYDFDRCTGLLSNRLTGNTKDMKSVYSSACAFFSVNSKIMYISTPNKLFQYNLTIPNIFSTETLIAEYDGYRSPITCVGCSTRFYMGTIAPNKKIYISSGNSSDVLHVINNPDSLGIACDFQQHSVQLPKIMAFGIPNFPNYHLGVLVGSGCDTLVSYQSSFSSYQNVYVYPNPTTKDKIFVGINHIPEGAKIIILNSLGQEMYQKEVVDTRQEIEISLAVFPVGIYYLQVQSDDNIFAEKIVRE